MYGVVRSDLNDKPDEVTVVNGVDGALNMAKALSRKNGHPYEVYKLIQTHHVESRVETSIIAKD